MLEFTFFSALLRHMTHAMLLTVLANLA